MKSRKTSVLERWYFWALAVIIGILLLVFTFVSSTKSDRMTAKNQLFDTVNYIKKQCTTYNSLNLASETKSLMRVMQAAQQVNRDISNAKLLRDEDGSSKEMLQLYAEEHYLTGVLILSNSGTLINEYFEDDLGWEKLQKYLTKNVVLNVAEHSEKTYSARIDCDDGTYIDLAAYGRSDEPGVIVTYYHTPEEYIQSYSLSYQNLLDGYSVEQSGTIVVTTGDNIVASNDENLIGKNTKEVRALQDIRNEAKDGELAWVRSTNGGRKDSYGVIDRGRDYYVYAYLPEREVFKSTPQKMLFAVIGYSFALFIILMVRWKTAQTYQEQQLQREKEYQEKLKESAEKAESANVAKTEFLQRMSHDIRTPINGIRGMVEIAEYHSDDTAKQEECLQKIWDASSLLLELVNEVLDMGKLESGEIVLESREFNVLELINEVCEVVEKQAEERKITIEYKKPEIEHTDLIGSPLHVKRLLMNILSNAVKYNKDHGKIFLDCREARFKKNQAWIEFVCADTGIGMSEEFQKQLFEPFTQESNDARSTYGGTGLGMAITKSLVDKMGGTITFESEQNVGTTYYITIPFDISKQKSEERQEQAVIDVNSLKGIHVLLAEDNDLNMEIAQFLLENVGIQVMQAHNGQEAVELFAKSEINEFDAILMDVMMPILDGHQATRKIRSMNRDDAKTVPIFAMTANAFADDRQKAFEAGMNEHLTKPLETEAVFKALTKYCVNNKRKNKN